MVKPGKLFDVVDDGGSTVRVLNVPIFRTHADRDYRCDEEWLDRCIADFVAQRAESFAIAGDEQFVMLPPVTIGHTPENPDLPEPPRVGFFDNLRRSGDTLYCDFVDLERDAFEQMRKNRFPYRSVEVIPSKFRITNVSLLGGRYPHFALPVMRFDAKYGGETVQVIRYTMRGGMMPNQGGGGPDGGNLNQDGAGPQQTQQIDLQALAQEIAPLVAQMIAEARANQGNIQAGAAAYKGKKKPKGKPIDVQKLAQKFAEGLVPLIAKYVEGEPDDEESQEGLDDPAKSKTDVKPGEKAADLDNEDLGTSDKDKKMTLERAAGEIHRLREDLKASRKDVKDLQQHNEQSSLAARKAMITAKVKEVAALGYAVGDVEAISRHVERMLTLKPDEVKAYIDDVLKKMPRVVDRHGTSDTVVRPGAGGDENERYYQDNEGTLRSLDMTKDVLDLADVLGGA